MSPLLANVYLHYVLDLWADWWRKTHARGDMIIVRFADDFIVGFQHQDDAERFLAELRSRFAKFGLELHPDKTRLIEFGRYAARDRKARGEGKPETFTFLGFPHICADDQGAVLGPADHGQEEDDGQAEAGESRDHAPPSPARPRPGTMAGSVIAGTSSITPCLATSNAVQAFRTRATRHWRHALSLDPPAILGGVFLARFLHEEFSQVNRGVVALPPAFARPVHDQNGWGLGSGWPRRAVRRGVTGVWAGQAVAGVGPRAAGLVAVCRARQASSAYQPAMPRRVRSPRPVRAVLAGTLIRSRRRVAPRALA